MTIVRLAYNPGPINVYKGILKEREIMPKLVRKEPEAEGPNERLALGAHVIKSVGDKALGPAVRLALSNDTAQQEIRLQPGLEREGGRLKRSTVPAVRLVAPNVEGNYQGSKTLESPELLPALLVSYVYLEPFLKNKHRYHYRDWVMDSGAFSAHNSGTEIVLQDYIDCCKRLLAEDPTLTEVFALDVIGDWKAGLKNCEEMWRQGVEAIPCFHYGEPWDVLKGIAKDYPKIALGGCVGKKDKDKFAGQCFSRIWPKRIHGFGFGSEKSIMMFPWHSVDATNWEIAPCKYGQWKAFGTQRVSVRGSRQNLRAEVEWYLDLERRARDRWRKEMEKLESLGPTGQLGLSGVHSADKKFALGDDRARLSVRLAADASSGSGERLAGAIGPTVRLSGAADDITNRRPIAFSKRGKEKFRPRKRGKK